MTQKTRPKKGEPGYKEWISDIRKKAAKKAYRDNPDLRDRRKKQMKTRYEDPGERKKTSQQQLERWSDPEEREKQRQRQLEFIETNPEITELRTKASQEYWSNEETRKTKSEELKVLWQDEEYRDNQRQRLMGNTYAKGNKGKPKSEEHKRKIGDAHRGRKLSPEHIEKIRQSKAGKTRKILTCKACSTAFPRNEITDNNGFCDDCATHTKLCACGCGEEIFKYKSNGETRKYLDNSHSSLHLWQDDNHRKSLKGRTGQSPGKEHWNWQGGKSFEPYDENFTYEFRESIRIRQNRICADIDKSCIHPEEVKLDVHHIDGNKLRSISENCVALCRSHHSRANLDYTTQARHYTFIKSI